MIRLRLATSTLVVCAACVPFAAAQSIGDRVVVVADDAPITVGKQVVDRAFQGMVLKIRAVGDAELRVDWKSGTIEKRQVINFAQALDHFTSGLVKAPRDERLYCARGDVYRELEQPDKAITDFDEAIRLEPRLAHAYFGRGRVYLGKQDHTRAIADFDEAIRLDPKFARAYNGRGLAWRDKGDVDKAMVDFNRATELDPQLLWPFFYRGLLWSNKDQPDKAIAEFDQALRLDPLEALILAYRGSAWADKGDSVKALTDLNDAVRLDPTQFTGYWKRAAVWFDNGNYDKAIADYDEILRRWPQDTSAFHMRARAWAKKGQIAKAMTDFEAALRLDPKNAHIYYSRALCWKDKGEHDKALADFDRVIQLDPKYAAAYYNRGVTRAEIRQYDKSIGDYNKALELNPKFVSAFNERGNAWFEKKEYDKALADFTAAIRLDAKYAVAYHNVGRTWYAKGDLDKAVDGYSRAIQLDPKDALPCYGRALAWRAQGHLEKAIADFTKAIDLAPGDPVVYYNRGLAWYSQGDRIRALGDFNQAIERKADFAEAYFSRGIIQYEANEFPKARSDIKRCVQLRPNLREAVQERVVGDASFVPLSAVEPIRPEPLPSQVTELTRFQLPVPATLAPDLLTSFSDDFSEDVRHGYDVRGPVTWKKGLLTLPPGALVNRRFRTGSPVELTLDLNFEPPNDDGDKAQTEFVIFLRSGQYLYVVLRRELAGGKVAAGVEILHGGYDSKEKRHLREPMRRFGLRSGATDGLWTLRYHYGLLQVEHAGAPVAQAYLEARGEGSVRSGWGALCILQRSGIVHCRRLQLSARIPEPALNYEDKLEVMARAQTALEQINTLHLNESIESCIAALSICQKALGDQHPDTIFMCDYVSYPYAVTADPRALQYSDKALSLARNVFGTDHPHTARFMARVAELREQFGDRDAAFLLYHAVARLYMRAYGEESLQVASILQHLGELHEGIRQYRMSTTCFESALQISRKILGEEDPQTMRIVARLAILHAKFDASDKAREFYEKASRFYEKTAPELAKETNLASRSVMESGLPFEVCGMNLALGDMAQRKKDYSAAARFFNQALKIGQTLPNRDQFVLLTHLQLGTLESAQANEDDARRHWQKALDIGQKLYGPYTHSNTTIMAVLGASYLEERNLAKAEEYLQEAFKIESQLAADMLTAVSEAEALQFISNVQKTRDSLVSVFQARGDVSSSDLYRIVWRSQGLVTRSMTARRQLYLENPAAQSDLLQLIAVRKRLAELFWSQVQTNNAESLRREVEKLNLDKEELERKLARESEVYQRLRQTQQVDFVDFARRLPANIAVVHILKSQNTMEKPKDRYMAFVLRSQADEPGYSVVLSRLGAAEMIDDAVVQWRKVIQQGHGGTAEKGAEVQELPQLRLRRLVWEPVEKSLGGCSTVVVIPDGALTRIPWSALPGKQSDSYLLEQYAIATASYGGQLYDLFQRAPPLKHTALIVGGVRYDAASKSEKAVGRQTGTTGPSIARDAQQPLHYPYLQGTLEEGKQIAELAQHICTTRFLEGAQATEATVRESLPEARFAHLATHGFFADLQYRSTLQGDASGESLLASAAWRGDASASVTRRSPLLLSGVVLAGANLPRQTNNLGLPIGDDGILSAEEIADLDLRGTELVVLSACETGLGQVAGGEGVFGLQRAFHLAGTRSVVASLWKVSDLGTQILMTRFYENLWQRKMPKLKALREAQLWMLREVPKQPDLLRGITRGGSLKFLEEDIQKEGRLPPYYWAGFVLSGDWR